LKRKKKSKASAAEILIKADLANIAKKVQSGKPLGPSERRRLLEVKEGSAPQGTYDFWKEAARDRASEVSRSGRDIGELPPVKDPKRRQRCKDSLRLHCETYHANTFCLEWSDDQRTIIAMTQSSILRGALYSFAMPRGSGKTSFSEVAVEWGVLHGHIRFPVLLGSSKEAALELLDSMKTELEANDLLLEDFPEICYPIRRLEGITNRCRGQLYHGQRTKMTITKHLLILPTIPGSVSSGSIIWTSGLLSRIRGRKHKLEDGTILRPDFVLPDDPQTRQSAMSPSQCHKRERILASDVLGLAGPGKKISGIMPCTVIEPNDMADRMLNRELHPEWQGTRMKMLYTFPSRMDLWLKYADVYRDCLRDGASLDKCTDFYKANRKAMDEGAQVAWPVRFNKDEISGLQHCMNFFYRDEAAFWAEGQNEPKPPQDDTAQPINAELVIKKLNGIPRGTLPLNTDYLTAFIDVQKPLLFYKIMAAAKDFTGSFIDYGSFPDQGRKYYSLSDSRSTLQKMFPKHGMEACLYAGLQALTEQILGREYKREDGAVLRISRCLIDASWGESTDIIYQFCRASKFAAILMPSHGRYVGAASIPFHDYQRRPGELVGLNWRIPSTKGKRAIRHVIYDTNFWKSFYRERLHTAIGDRGAISLFQGEHRLLGDHLASETPLSTVGRGRTVEEWRIKASRPDNHFLDCGVGCCVAASMKGAHLQHRPRPATDEKLKPKPPRRRVSYLT
jgi:hypothetical protein